MNGRVLAGVLLLLLGVGFGVAGYERMQPTIGETVLSATADFMGQKVPEALQRDKSDAYILLAAGAGLFAIGLVILIRQPQRT